MDFRPHILLSILVVFILCQTAKGQQRIRHGLAMPIDEDSTVVDKRDTSFEIEESERVKKFYDSLKSKTHSSGFSRFLYKSLFREPKKISEIYGDGRVIDESKHFEKHQGKTIEDVIIWRLQIFDQDETERDPLRRFANKAHILTTQSTIKHDLLFRSGDKVDAEQIVNNKRILKTRNYLSGADIYVVPNTVDTTKVDIVIVTRDKWTISADLRFKGSGKTMLEVYDANFLGWGDKLSIKNHFNRKNFGYRGNLVTYEMPNVYGTFYRAKVELGRSFDEQKYGIELRKDFIKPSDYDVGFSLYDVHEDYYQLYVDTTAMIKYREFGVWGGKSFYMRGLRNSLFLTSKFKTTKFRERPPIPDEVENKKQFNPAFHNNKHLLFGFGFYKERFFTSNMIYGFGYNEYLPVGYKTELISGYSWGEHYKNIYLGIDFAKGGFSPGGYFMGRTTLGSYIDPKSGRWTRSGVDVEGRWISNLWTPGSCRVRQFLTLTYTHGWNRWEGNNEVITYTREDGPRTLRDWMIGNTRLVLNTETVIFTPLQPLGFRIAFFGFADFGLLGFNSNPFSNAFCTTLGLGVRFKNERLVFKTIQIRLGIALGKHGVLDNNYFRLSNEHRMDSHRFIPTAPEIVRYE